MADGHEGRFVPERISSAAPEFANRVERLAGMDVFVLDVKLNRVEHWHLAGLLIIGGAAEQASCHR